MECLNTDCVLNRTRLNATGIQLATRIGVKAYLLAMSILSSCLLAKANRCEDLFSNAKQQSAEVASEAAATSTTKPKITLAKLLKQIDITAANLKQTDDFISPPVWRKMTASYGLPGLDLPKELGGSEFTASQMIKVMEHIGTYSLNMRDMVGGAHSRPLLNSSTPEVRKIVSDVAEGKAYVAIAITEKEVGSDIRAMGSISEKVEDGYLVTGEKMYNARFKTATHVILFTKANPHDAADSKLNAFVVPISYPGLKFVQKKANGLHGNSFGGVSFDHVFIPEKYRIGGHGEGGKVFRNHFLYWRLMMAATAIGTAKGAITQAVERLRTRQAFGGPIGRFTHFQQALAEHTTKLHMLGLLVQDAAKKIDQGKYEEAIPLVAMAKGEGVEWALRAADFAMELFGAQGYSGDVDLAQRVADLQGLRIADGTTHVMRQEVVRSIYGDDFWQMIMGNAGP